MTTIKLLDADSNIVKESLFYCEYPPQYVYWDGMVYEFGYSRNDTIVYFVKANAISL